MDDEQPYTGKLWYCCLCGLLCGGWGNNPAPLKARGKCCDTCNATKVIPARIRQIEKAERERHEAENA